MDASYVANSPHSLVTMADLERPTVVSPLSATPTKSETITAIKLLPHYTNDAAFWSVDHDFYVQDANPATKMNLIKYRGTAVVDTEETKMFFWLEKLTLMV